MWKEALRSPRQAPLFASVAMAFLAAGTGVGGNMAIFHGLDQLLPRPLACFQCTGPSAPGAAEPASRALMREVVRKFEEEAKNRREFAFLRLHERLELSSDSTVKKKQSWLVRQSLEEGFMVERLIERDGKPLSADELQRNEALPRKDLDSFKALSAAERERHREEELRAQAAENAWVKELPEALDSHLIGEETRNGRRTLVFAFSPRPGYRPRNFRTRVFQKVNGKLWVDKEEQEVVRAEAETFDEVSVGWGFIGRIDKGTRFAIERQRFEPAVWLTTSSVARFVGRILLVKSLNEKVTTLYSDYHPRSGLSPAGAQQEMHEAPDSATGPSRSQERTPEAAAGRHPGRRPGRGDLVRYVLL